MKRLTKEVSNTKTNHQSQCKHQDGSQEMINFDVLVMLVILLLLDDLITWVQLLTWVQLNLLGKWRKRFTRQTIIIKIISWLSWLQNPLLLLLLLFYSVSFFLVNIIISIILRYFSLPLIAPLVLSLLSLITRVDRYPITSNRSSALQ